MLDLSHPAILKLFPEHLDPGRSESASFLIWYLENYYRIETAEAIHSVCDQKGDKGVDGIYVNNDDQTITIFQSKIHQRRDKTIGDAALKSFSGTLGQFADANSVRQLEASAGNAEVAKLIRRLKLDQLIESYEVRGEFLSNRDLDVSGASYLAITPMIDFVGKTVLDATYVSPVRALPGNQKTVRFDIGGFRIAEYTVDAKTKSVIAPIRATELVNLDGISDQSLFEFNVRGPLGRTGVNKDIVKSIQDKSTHRLSFVPQWHHDNIEAPQVK